MLATVVLAAGKGTRMHSGLPKVLHELLGVSLLDLVVETTTEVGTERQVVVIGYERERVREAFAGRDERLFWAVQDQQLGTAHAAHVGIEALGEICSRERVSFDDVDVLVVNGDLPLLRVETLRGLLETHRAHNASVSILSCRKSDPTGYGRLIRDSDGRLRDIIEEQDAEESIRAMREINVGTYVFRASRFQEFYSRIDRENAQGELYLTDVVVEAAGAGHAVETFEVVDESEIAQVNSRRELTDAAAILEGRVVEKLLERGVIVDDPRNTYIEKGVEIGPGTRIHPFTVLRRGVRIGTDCDVGPFAHLRAGTVLEDGASIGNFVEIKNTRVGARSKARHLTYLGDGQVGRGVNVGAGTILANYDGKTKHRTEIGDGAFIGSGTILVAPVKIGAGAVTGAGAVVLKNRDVADGEVVAGVPARSTKKTAGKR